MKLNISIILEALSESILETSIQNSDVLFEGFSVYCGNEKNEKLIYLWDDSCFLNQNLPETCLFFKSEDFYRYRVTNSILLTSSISKLQIASKLEELFRKASLWEKQLNESLLREEGVKKLMEISIPIFSNPIILMDFQYRVLFHVDVPNGVKLSERYNNEITENQIIGEKMMSAIISSEEYLEAMKFGKATLWSDKIWSGTFMNVNAEQYCLLINNCNRPFCESDKYYLKYLMSIIMRSIKYRNLYPAFSIDDIRLIIAKATSFEMDIDTKNIVRLAQCYGWSMNDLFTVSVIYPPSKHLMRNTILFLCVQLEKQINGCKAFALEDKIVAIFNMERIDTDKDKIIFELEQFLLKNQLQGGMSAQFNDLKELQPHIHQAIYAFETGISQPTFEHLYLFQNYLLEYMLIHAKGKLDERYLIPEGIRKLQEHDRTTGSQYIKVLQVYLENKCNITDSAKELYLGRSTFLYQLERIKTILDMDLNDRDIRLTLLLVLRLNMPNEIY